MAVLAITLAGILLSVVSIYFLAETVRQEAEALAVSSSDSTHWSMGQTEVDLLQLQGAVHKALVGEDKTLADVRTRFDVLYSRIDLIAQSEQFAELRKFPDAQSNLERLQGFLERQVPVIDGPDDSLRSNLSKIAEEIEGLQSVGRDFALMNVKLHAADSDTRRKTVATTLVNIGYLTALLVLALLAGMTILVAMFRRIIRSEANAADARNRLQNVIATSIDGIIATNPDGRIIEYNGAAEGLFGYSRAEAIGQDISVLVIPNHLRDAHQAGMQRYRETRERRVLGKGLVRLEALRKGGTVFPVEVSLSAANFEGQEVFVAFLRDISDRVADEKEVIEARDSALAGERAKAALLAVMSHEMRTPLNGILGTIQLMQGTGLSRKQGQFIAAMKTSAELLLHHVNSVLGMSRAEAQQLDLEPVEIDPAALVGDLVESQRHTIEANGNRISFNATYTPARLWADPLRLRQVILNLIGNANKFTRNGDITVECDTISDSRMVEFRVIDTGIGIAEDDLERIFEEFRILDTSYSRKTEGTGLGLSISRKLVRAMGGEIGVASELGEGSLFWVRIPFNAPESAVASNQGVVVTVESAKGAAPTKAMRILLVEDNQINRLVSREFLQSAGHNVVEAHDGREAVRMSGTMAFDLILMDISMPEIDGLTATVLIRDGEGPNRLTPIVAVTAFALPDDIERFREAGISATLIKPFSQDELLAVLDGAMASVSGSSHDQHHPMPDAFRDLRARLGREKANGLYQGFIGEGNELIARILSDSWSSESATSRAEAVHKVAGSAALLGANRFRKLLLLLEGDYRSGKVEAATRHTAHLKVSWDETLSEINGLTKT